MKLLSLVSMVCGALAFSPVFGAESVTGASRPGTLEVSVDATSPVGIVKPVNGVGQPPMIGVASGAPMFHYLKEAGIPYSRLHDAGGAFGGMLWADIPNIFRNFDADETRAENYDFEATDHLVRELMKNGVEPFYRLGVTIENHGFKPKRIFPPKDFAKWARICEHIIRHYTEGWANGFTYKITYWEIWNEPDGHQDIAQNCMWKDTFTRYCDFYGVVAPYLKQKFPHLKIGGYASCGFYAGVGAGQVKAANSSPRMQYFITCAKEFLDRARKENWPLDFFSYHSYSEVPSVLEQVAYADSLLNEYGFTREKCERIFNEWLPRVSHKNLGTAYQASAIAAELVGLQNGPCDVACIYDARCTHSDYSALFNPATKGPYKAYYAFTAFNELRQLKTAVKTSVKGGTAYACAASDGTHLALMLANPNKESLPCRISAPGFSLKAYRLTDDTRTNQAYTGIPKELGPYSFLVVLGTRDQTVYTDYVASAATANESASFTLVPESTWNKTELQPIGRDGWRRVDGHGRAFVSVVNGDGHSGKVVRFTRAPWWIQDKRDTFAHIVHPIGRTFTKGKVSILADLSTPDVWHFTSRRIMVGLGNAALAESRGNEWNEFVAYAGIRGTDEKTFCPGWSEPRQQDGIEPATKLTASCWFRIKMTVDLDAKTSEFRLYRIGGRGLSLEEDDGKLELAFEKKGMGLYNDLGEISTLFVSVYGAGSTEAPREQVWLDNLKVFAGDFSTGTLVYSNDFDVRTRNP